MAKLISRRDFLKGTAAGAFSIAAASVLGTGTNFAAHAEGAAKYIPGTYTAKAQGLESEVTVTMTFDETSILDVVIDSSGETPELGGRAGPLLEKAILDAQSGEVDAVSGATITSNAVRTAVNDCIAQATGAAPAAAGEAARILDLWQDLPVHTGTWTSGLEEARKQMEDLMESTNDPHLKAYLQTQLSKK